MSADMSNTTAPSATKPLDLAQFDGHTPGPWKSRSLHPEGVSVVSAMKNISRGSNFDNARLIAAAPALLAEVKRQRAEIAELREALASFLRAPSTGSVGSGSITITVQDFNIKSARAALSKAQQ